MEAGVEGLSVQLELFGDVVADDRHVSMVADLDVGDGEAAFVAGGKGTDLLDHLRLAEGPSVLRADEAVFVQVSVPDGPVAGRDGVEQLLGDLLQLAFRTGRALLGVGWQDREAEGKTEQDGKASSDHGMDFRGRVTFKVPSPSATRC